METFRPVGRCIYCEATDCVLSDEHIVPYALNGSLVLPKSSCEKCADITKKFEQIVTRTVYGPLRVKKGYKTRRKRERPKSFPVASYNHNGEKQEHSLLVNEYPTLYVAVTLPPPGILSGAPLSDMNPEMQVALKGDKDEIAKAISSIQSGNLELSSMFQWGAFCRLLAKIAHCYVYAKIGDKGYKPLLPDLILGRSQYLSHYVGGVISPTDPNRSAYDLTVAVLQDHDPMYLAVFIHLLGAGRLPIYQVIAGVVTDLAEVVSSLSAEPKPA